MFSGWLAVLRREYWGLCAWHNWCLVIWSTFSLTTPINWAWQHQQSSQNHTNSTNRPNSPNYLPESKRPHALWLLEPLSVRPLNWEMLGTFGAGFSPGNVQRKYIFTLYSPKGSTTYMLYKGNIPSNTLPHPLFPHSLPIPHLPFALASISLLFPSPLPQSNATWRKK